MTVNVYETGVGGLICRQCEDILIGKMSYVRGVIDVKCSYFKGRVIIRYDPDLISESDLKSNLEKIGFPAKEKNCNGKWYDVISVVAIAALFCLVKFVNLPLIPRADNNTSYFGLFLIGLVTGTHCMVMCGGIMLSQTAQRSIDDKQQNGKKRILPVVFYNAGRVITAGILGFIFGSIGKYITFSMKAKSIVFTLTGIYILLIALGIWGVPFVRRLQTGIPSLCELKKKNKFAAHAGPFLAGVFTALLPCASSNSMWLISVSAGGGLKGMSVMLSWAIGTVPCMLLFGLFSGFLNGKRQALMIRLNIILMTTLGLNLLFMGLSMI